jgi:hypothetical protein
VVAGDHVEGKTELAERPLRLFVGPARWLVDKVAGDQRSVRSGLKRRNLSDRALETSRCARPLISGA